MSSFEKLFNPRGIAIVGASPDANRPGAQTLAALARRGYAGGVYPVNPKYDEIGGRRCYASVEDVPQPCDVAVVALPAPQVCEVIALCGKRGIGYAVVLGGGFREAGEEGIALERRLLETARAAGVRIVGPNCLGYVSIHNNAYAAFGSLSKPPELQPGGVSAVIQSGGFGNSIIMRCAAAGIGFRHIVASGNETDISAPELIQAYANDPATEVIFAYLEGVRDGRAFMQATQHALRLGKPVVIWKAGNSRQGQRAAASHTANMTASYDVYRAAFRQCGVVEVFDIDEAIDFIQCRLMQNVEPAGGNVVIMGGSGGSAVVFSDAADQYGLDLVKLEGATRAAVAEALPRAASIENPIDYTAGFLTDENAPRFAATVDAVLRDPAIDQLAVLFATVIGKQVVNGANVLAAAKQRYGKPIYAFCSPPEALTGGAYETLRAAGIPNLSSPRRIARVMGTNVYLAKTRAALTAAHAAAPDGEPAPDVSARSGTLNEHDGKRMLAAYGITTTNDTLLPACEIPRSELGALPYPVALKIVSRDIAHKSDIGGVKLHIADAAALEDAIASMLRQVRTSAPDATLEGLLVSGMVNDGVETLVGIVNDPTFGPVVAFGLGGVQAELFRDLTYRIAPFGVDAARDMIGELRASHVFSGFRGRPPCDVEALAHTLAAISRLAWHQRERLVELDINPLLVRPEGRGVVAADALVVFRDAT